MTAGGFCMQRLDLGAKCDTMYSVKHIGNRSYKSGQRESEFL